MEARFRTDAHPADETLQVLIVDDSLTDAELIARELNAGGLNAAWQRVDTRDDLKRLLDTERWDVVLIDYTIPGFSGIEAIRLVRAGKRVVPVVVVTGTIGEERAVETIKAGAQDYLLKDRLQRLPIAVAQAIRDCENQTHEKRTREVLLRAAKEWRTTFDSISSPVVLLDEAGVIRRCNRAYRDLAAKPYADLLGRRYLQIDGELVRKCDEALPGFVDEVHADQSLTFSLNDRYYHGALHRVVDGEGAGMGFVYGFDDVTERQKAEYALRQSETKYRLLSENSTDIIVSHDLDGMISYVNAAGLAALEYKHDEISSLHIYDIIAPTDRERLAFGADGTHNAGQLFEMEYVSRSGTRVFVEVKASTIVDGGRTVGVLMNARNISRRKQAEAKLAFEQSLMESFMKSIPDMIYFKDAECRFIRINDAQARFLGVSSPADAVGTTDAEYFRSEHAKRSAEDDARVLATGAQIIGKEEPMAFADRPERWVSTTKVPFRDADGRIAGMFGISRDITEKKRLETMMMQSSKMEAIGRLAGGAAHEFNNMMTVINAFSDVLLARLSAENEAATYAAKIKETVRKAVAITDQLLLFARRRPGSPQRVDVASALQNTEKMLRPILRRGITLELCIDPDLLHTQIDPVQLDQVVMNLVINARDAIADDGSITIEASNLTVDAAYHSQQQNIVPGEYLAIRVSDSGSGIPESVLPKLFEPFFTTKVEGKGTGLGLAVVYQIVTESKGDVRVFSKVGEGTTFEIVLPSALDEDAPPDEKSGKEP